MMETMTSTPEEQPARCRMGSKMPKPCPFPATVALADDSEVWLCAFHAALIPLADEVDELNASLDLARTYLKAARRHPGAGPLQTILERAEVDLAERLELIHKTMKDLRRAEYSLIR